MGEDSVSWLEVATVATQAPARPQPGLLRGHEAVSLAQLLRRLPLFAALDAQQSAQLAAASEKRRHQRGELLLRQGDQAHELCLLLSGRAQSFRTDARGREVIIDLIRSGDPIGDLSLIDGQPHSASVRCEEDCDLLAVPGSAFAMCLAANPALAQAVLVNLSQRVRGAFRRVASLAHHDVGDRLLQRLIDLATPEGGELVLRDRIARQDLAKMIGASREMVSRTMKELELARTIRYRPDGAIVIQPSSD